METDSPVDRNRKREKEREKRSEKIVASKFSIEIKGLKIERFLKWPKNSSKRFFTVYKEEF